MSKHLLRGLAALTIGLAAPAAAAPPAAPAADKQVCIDAHTKAQELRVDGKLIDARDQLATCARASCPAIARVDCARWLDEVAAETPTITVEVVDDAGARVADASVEIDGKTVRAGDSLAVDPGRHKAKASLGESRVEAEVRVERKAREVVRLKVARRQAPAGEKRFPWGAVAFSGLAVAGGATFAYFGLTGRAGEEDLKRCKPRCPLDDIDRVRTQYIVADVALGVSVLSAGLAVYLFATHGSEETPSKPSVSIAVTPGAGSMAASVSGRF